MWNAVHNLAKLRILPHIAHGNCHILIQNHAIVSPDMRLSLLLRLRSGRDDR